MKLVLFIYDFPHKKSLKGMQLIKSKGIEDVYVIASPKVELKFRQSKNRVSVLETEIIEPSTLANQYGWDSLVTNHNSEEAISFLKKIKIYDTEHTKLRLGSESDGGSEDDSRSSGLQMPRNDSGQKDSHVSSRNCFRSITSSSTVN